jgi:hypothetical protein
MNAMLDQEFTNCLLEKKGALEFEVLENLNAQSPLGSDYEGEQFYQSIKTIFWIPN